MSSELTDEKKCRLGFISLDLSPATVKPTIEERAGIGQLLFHHFRDSSLLAIQRGSPGSSNDEVEQRSLQQTSFGYPNTFTIHI